MVHVADNAAGAVHAAVSAGKLDPHGRTSQKEDGTDLPHAYFLEEARRALSHGQARHPADPAPRPGQQLPSSACFDAWALDPDPE